MKKILLISAIAISYLLYRKIKKHMKFDFDIDFSDTNNIGI